MRGFVRVEKDKQHGSDAPEGQAKASVEVRGMTQIDAAKKLPAAQDGREWCS
jgi:hypothetical protein